MSLPTIVIIGRRNVGKSALFNRLIEQEKAIVSEIPGTTRDRTEGVCRWRGQKIRIIDTGGLDAGDDNTIDREVKKQTRFAIKKANLILFLVDARVGPLPGDAKLAKELHLKRPSLPDGDSVSTHTPIVLVANKSETDKWRQAATNPSWKRLGFDVPIPISALTGQGVGDLLDKIFQQLKIWSIVNSYSSIAQPDLRVAIIGKPNVGKSSLLNKILGEERVIVSPTPHTTREPQDTLIEYQKSNVKCQILLIDTAGIRRKSHITPGIEKAGVTKTMAVINKADVVFFVLDATTGIDFQDKHLSQMIEEKGVGVIVMMNKWDLIKIKNQSPTGSGTNVKNNEFLIKTVRFGLPGLDFAPVVPISALTGHNVHKLLITALKIQESRDKIIPKEELKKLLPKLILRHKPTKDKGTRHPVIRRIEQTGTRPPAFMAVIGPKQSLHQSYLRFIQNQLREFYDFEGTPIKVFAKQEKN